MSIGATFESTEKQISATVQNNTSALGAKVYGGGSGGSGVPGKDGVSCTHSWDGTVLTITSASGTSSADLKGEKGDTGEKGDAAGGKSVAVYGAVGDGSTDDTLAFQTALAENRTVYVPGGTYKLSSGLVIGDNCELELSQDAVLEFTMTSGNCITLGMSSSIKGHHATVNVPYAFSGNVVYASSTTTTDQTAMPPFNKWTPMWKTGRYVTDLNICKVDSRGFHYSVNGDCSGTAVYISADGGATSTYMWGIHYSGLRIAGAFSFGIRAVNVNDGWVHEMRVDAFIDACEIGVSLEECNNAYVSAIVQPRRAYTTGEAYLAYAKQGIRLINSKNVDLSGSRVWDWNATNSLWVDGGEYQHLALYGECRGLILNDFLYYEQSSTDIRGLIYTDTASNLEQMVILQEPFTRWFKPIDGEPYFSDGYTDKKLITQEVLDYHFDTQIIKSFTDVLSTATDTDGTVLNGIGYKMGGHLHENGTVYDSAYYGYTGFIPCQKGSQIYAKGLTFAKGDDNCKVIFYDADMNYIMHVNRGNVIAGNSYYVAYAEEDDGFVLSPNNVAALNNIAYARFTFYKTAFGVNPMMAIDEEIKYTVEGTLADGIGVKGDSMILSSAGGKSYKLSVDDSGALSTVLIE